MKTKIIDQGIFFPAKEFAEVSGLNWVYTNWVLPNNMSELACQNLVLNLYKNNKKTELLLFYTNLQELNPIFVDVKSTNIQVLFDLCMGIISKFIYEDIIFYSQLHKSIIIYYNNKIWNTLEKLQIELYNKLIKNPNINMNSRIMKGNGVHLCQWVLSPTTFAKLKEL